MLGRRVDLNDACKAYITISIVSLGTIDNKRNVNVVKVQLLRYFSRPLDSHLHLGFSVGRERKLRPIKRKTFRGNEASVRTFFFSMVVKMKERKNIDNSRMFCKKTKKIWYYLVLHSVLGKIEKTFLLNFHVCFISLLQTFIIMGIIISCFEFQKFLFFFFFLYIPCLNIHDVITRCSGFLKNFFFEYIFYFS